MIRLEVSGLKAIFFVFILIILFAPHSLAFEITPPNPMLGQEITISGKAKPGETLSFESSFVMNLPVSGGQYEYETTIQVPQKPNRFTVSAKNVQDLNAGVKIIIWITKSFQASGGAIRLSQADVPPGRYNLKMFGSALPGSTVVPVDIDAETQVTADSNGQYRLTIDTTGVPAGSYRITGQSETKTICLGGSCTNALSAPQTSLVDSDTQSSEIDVHDAFSGSNADRGTSTKKTGKSVGVNAETVKWYAGQIGLSAENSSQLDEAEEQLRARLAGGYWKIIKMGDPLTEEAGDCQQEYCLVRGTDACTVCRDKDIILKGGKQIATEIDMDTVSGIIKNSSNNSTTQASLAQNGSNSSQPAPDLDRGIAGKISDWLFGWLKKLFGGQ